MLIIDAVLVITVINRCTTINEIMAIQPGKSPSRYNYRFQFLRCYLPLLTTQHYEARRRFQPLLNSQGGVCVRLMSTLRCYMMWLKLLTSDDDTDALLKDVALMRDVTIVMALAKKYILMKMKKKKSRRYP